MSESDDDDNVVELSTPRRTLPSRERITDMARTVSDALHGVSVIMDITARVLRASARELERHKRRDE